MRIKVFILCSFCFSVVLFSGCAAFWKGDATGYEVSKDSVKSVTSVSYDRVYEASLETIRDIGGISEDKKSEGWIRTQLRHHYVTVHIEKLTDATVQITVSARKYAIPKTQYAQDVLTKILIRIKQQPLWLR